MTNCCKVTVAVCDNDDDDDDDCSLAFNIVTRNYLATAHITLESAM